LWTSHGLLADPGAALRAWRGAGLDSDGEGDNAAKKQDGAERWGFCNQDEAEDEGEGAGEGESEVAVSAVLEDDGLCHGTKLDAEQSYLIALANGG
jgi:hypothetical protein